MELIRINDNEDLNGLLAAIEQNIRTSSIMRKEIEKHHSSTNVIEGIEDKQPPITENPNLEPDIYDDESFEDDILYYLGELFSLPSECTKDEIKEVLPNKEDYDYENVLLRLMAELVKENRQIETIINEEEMSAEDKEELNNEIKENARRQTILKELFLEREKEEEAQISEENKLVFMPTQSGNPCVISELKHIDPEYYEGFIGLFDSIISGKFKNRKRLTSNSTASGLLEVKDFKIRVVFSRLGPKEYCVITAFTKKTDNNKDYQEQLNLRAASFKKMESVLKENIQNEDFMQLQATYQEELYNLLGKNNEKPFQKVKTGEEK